MKRRLIRAVLARAFAVVSSDLSQTCPHGFLPNIWAAIFIPIRIMSCCDLSELV